MRSLYLKVYILLLASFGAGFMIFAQTNPGIPERDVASVEAPAVDWAQPPVGCAEEMIPSIPEKECLDLSKVTDAHKDWPEGISDSDRQYWYGHRRWLAYCRALEVEHREVLSPGHETPGYMEISWMITEAVKQSDEKIEAIYSASKLHKIPPQILTGAIYQESLFADLGIVSDGGNYSCGVGQVNLQEWCEWANKQGDVRRKAIGWPSQDVSCSETFADPRFIEPFFDIAHARLGDRPSYKMTKDDFKDISFASVAKRFGQGSEDEQKIRYKLARSFIDHCSEPRNGILAKADALASLYAMHVPQSLKDRDRYVEGQKFERVCKNPATTNAYPLQTGWLMAVAIYNAGPRVLDAVASYNVWDQKALDQPATWKGFNPQSLIDSIYGAGKYDPAKDLIEFKSLNGEGTKSWIWFKGCVAQRHIDRVIQHVTLLPEFFVHSLEGSADCRKSKFDDGVMTLSAVPKERASSSGLKDH